MIKAIKVTPQDDYSIMVTLEDGRVVRFDMQFVKGLNGPVVNPLKNIDEFKKAFVRNGIVTWPSGYDIDPYYLIEESTPVNKIA